MDYIKYPKDNVVHGCVSVDTRPRAGSCFGVNAKNSTTYFTLI